jgi:hypothetical protein
MNDDWLDELRQLRAEDEAVRQAQIEQLDLTLLNRHERAVNLLRQCEAHNLLRQVNNALLNGKGLIELFSQTNGYEQAVVLMWQGPISRARWPQPKDPEDYFYIMVGAKKRLYVNGKQLEHPTPEALKKALVEASKKPGLWTKKNAPALKLLVNSGTAARG